MAIDNPSNKKEFVSAGTTNEQFPFNRPYFAESDIVVTRQQADGTITTLAINTDYTLTPTNGDTLQGGTVIAVTNFTAGDIIVVARIVPFTQEYDLQEGSDIDPTALNTAFDRIVSQNQQQEENFERTIQHPITDPDGTTYTVGSTTERANKALGYDSNGNVTELSLLTTGTVSVNTNKGLEKTGNIISCKSDGTTITFDGSGQFQVSSIGNANLTADSVDTNEIQDGAVTFSKLSDISTDISSDSSATKTPTADAVKTYADSLDVEYVSALAGTIALVQTTTATGETSYTYNIADFTGTPSGGGSVDTSKIRKVLVEIDNNSTGVGYVEADFPVGGRMMLGDARAITLEVPVNAGQGVLNLYVNLATGNIVTTIKGYIIKI